VVCCRGARKTRRRRRSTTTAVAAYYDDDWILVGIVRMGIAFRLPVRFGGVWFLQRSGVDDGCGRWCRRWIRIGGIQGRMKIHSTMAAPHRHTLREENIPKAKRRFRFGRSHRRHHAWGACILCFGVGVQQVLLAGMGRGWRGWDMGTLV